ncbi:MAG: hypothetical protein RR661_03490, partial [Anaerovoracaceae bacterium]
IGGSSAMFKVREIPNMGEDKVLEWMKGEFASEDQLEEEELIYDYATIAPGPEGGQTALLCAIKKSILEQYIRLLGDLEITISCIDVGIASQVKLLNRMKEAEGKTFIMLYLIGNNLDASLYVDGVLKIFVRSRLLYDRGSSGFEEELAQNISKMIQFNKSEGRDGAIDSIYLAGFSQEKDWIQAQQEGGFAIPLKELSEAAAGEVTCNDGEFSINDYMCAVGNLIRE